MKDYNPDDPTQLANWFDVYNRDHVKAWHEKRSLGYLPKWFQELMASEGVKTHYHWDNVIESRLADAWVKYALQVFSIIVEG